MAKKAQFVASFISGKTQFTPDFLESVETVILTVDTVSIAPNDVTVKEIITLSVDTVSVSPNPITARVVQLVAIDSESIKIFTNPVADRWALPPEKQYAVRTIYICFLGDLELPMSSFNARQRNGEQSYLSVVIPNITAYEDDISTRTDQDIMIKKGYLDNDGVRFLETIIVSNYDSLRIDQGAESASGTMVGYKQRTYSEGSERTIENISYRNVGSDGKLRLRGDVDLFIQPGDTCLYSGDSFIIDMISYYVTPRLAYMEVSE